MILLHILYIHIVQTILDTLILLLVLHYDNCNNLSVARKGLGPAVVFRY